MAVVPQPLLVDERTRDLVAQLEDQPRDRGILAVLADVLQQRGDPRGELIALQLAIEAAPPRIDPAWQTRRDELFDALAPGPVVQKSDWGIGFVRKLGGTFDSKYVEYQRALFDHDSSRLVTELDVTSQDVLAGESLHAALPRTIRKLTIRGELAAVPRVIAGLARLEHVTLYGRIWEGELEHPSLVSIHFTACAADVLSTCRPAVLPKLREVAAFRSANDSSERVLAALLRSGLLAQLERVRLQLDVVTDFDIDGLVGELRGRRLARLEIEANRVPATARARLAPFAHDLVITGDIVARTVITWVEHANKPEWGRGRLVRRVDDKLEVAFESSSGPTTRIFKATAPFLRIVEE